MLNATKDLDRFWSKVNKSDDCWLWTAGKTKKGYGQFVTCKDAQPQKHYAHRLSFELANGPITPGAHIDHTCYTKACVNPAHLRETTPKQNNENREGAQRNSASGIRGVNWYKRTSQWVAAVHHHGQKHFLGYFNSIEEAEAAVIAKRNELFTHNDQDRVAA